MRVLLLGADGFIGRHLAYTLRGEGHHVLACARRTTRLDAMGFETLKVDLLASQSADSSFWTRHLEGVTHVVNCAGLLNGPAPAMKAVHETAPAALYAALAGRPALLLSAVGIDTAETPFAVVRREGERIARQNEVMVLRAGLVLGDTSWGGSSLGRAMAAMPFRIPVVGDGAQRVNPIHANDLARQIIFLLENPEPAALTETGGPETITQARMLQAYRAWFGLKKVPLLRMPLPLARAFGRLGDALRLGPISATSVDQLVEGVQAKPDPALPAARPFGAFLAERPAGTQDLWHARLFLLRPLIRLTLAVLWIISGLIGLLTPLQQMSEIESATGLSHTLFAVLARGGGLVDLAIATALLRNWRPRTTALAQLIVVAAYTAGLTLLAPELWLLPFGGLLKNLPILCLILVSLALEDDR